MAKKNKKFPFKDTKKILSYLVVIIIFSFLTRNIFQNWEQIREIDFNFNIFRLLLILILSICLHVLNSLSWHLLTKAIGLKISFAENMRIWMLPNLSRYVPGVIWQYVGRVYMLSKKGVTKSQSMLALLLDAVFTFSMGSVIVLFTTLLFKFQPGQNYRWILFCVTAFPIVIIFLFSNKKVMTSFLKLLNKVTHKSYSPPSHGFSYIWLILSSFVTLSQFLVAGGVLYLIVYEFFKISVNVLPVFAGIYAAAWILGYLSFFAPGGLGVQELSMTGLLSLIVPLPISSLSSIFFRLALVISELIVSFLALWSSKKSVSIKQTKLPL